MDQDPAELSRERAVSSEPCSTRPNPFDESDSSSRKRQRVSRHDSRSRSVDTARGSDPVSVSASVPDSRPLREDSTKPDSVPPLPQTPTRMPSEAPPEPTSSRVTINLRTARPLESIPSSPPSPNTPSKMVNGGEDTGTRVSVESESDALSTIPPIETPSSSPSSPSEDDPPFEVVPANGNDGDFESPSPPVVILDGDTIYSDPMTDFPYVGGESYEQGARNLAHYMQYNDVPNEDIICKFRDWMENYVNCCRDPRTFYENFVKNREFWIVFPDIIWALSYRSKFFGGWLHNRRDGRQAVSEMFSQYARIAGKFVDMDVRLLAHHLERGDIDQIPDLGSHQILRAYTYLLKRDETSHIGRNLETHYHWNWDENIMLMTSGFQGGGGTIANLTKLVMGLLKLMPQIPKIIETLTEPCRLAMKIVADAFRTLDKSPQPLPTLNDAREQISQGYEFFKVMSTGLNAIIEKHVTYLSPDAAHCYLSSLAAILRNALNSDSETVQSVIETHRVEHPELTRKQLPKVISMEWRFTVLKKLITSTQMQLRVVGVTTMCGDLLAMYNTYKEISDPPRSPVLLHFAEFVLNNKLVDYVVSLGSHPEIINESHNIVGFLIVTKTYTSELTELIWQTVMTSQDPRVVEAILRMIRQCMSLYEYTHILHMCQKICDLPIEAFTPPMREFCENLLNNFVSKGRQDGMQYIDAPPYDLCIRLIRQASIATAESPIGYPDIQNFAVARLRDLLPHGPSLDIRSTIYQDCIEDVSSRTPTAPGSICIICTFLRQNKATDLHVLATQKGLTQLVVEELERAITGDRHPSVMNGAASLARRELLLMIMINEPGTISPDLGRRLWDHLVGVQSGNVNDQNISWSILNSAMKKDHHNPFIKTCLRDYLPSLPPHCFTTGALDFARADVSLWLDEIAKGPPENQKFESPALQQIWRMILNAPLNSIDAAAIAVIVEVYVESALISSMSRIRARDIHLALVDRCLKQLAGAASKLRQFTDGTSSGDEDGMVIVPSDGQFQEQERIFARSLAVLREFLKAYSMKPQFSFPSARYPPPATSDAAEGEPMVVKYQSFDGNNHTEVKNLTLGKQNTAAYLFATLQKATGFQKYKVFCGGKEITSAETDVLKSLEELNVNGLVLVQRREDAEAPAPPTTTSNPDGNRVTIEAEIVKHSDALWGYLSMHETVATEIYHFLIQFPIYEKVLDEIDSETTSYTVIFPQGEPFKSLYAIHALRQHIIGRPQKGSTDERSLARAASLIVDAISDPAVVEGCPTDELKDFLALHLTDCLVSLLKEPLLPSAIPPLLNESLLSRLLRLLQDARSLGSTQSSVHLTFRIFEALLEASLFSPDLWNSFVVHLKGNSLLRDLLLDDPRSVVRKGIAKHVVSKCSFTPSLARVSSIDFSLAFWPIVSTLIPDAIRLPYQCEETFALCHSLFRKLAESSISILKLDDLVKEWGSLLLSHDCTEIVGQPESIDMVAQGLSNLLRCTATFAKAAQQDLSCSVIGTEIVQRHLFPQLHPLPEADDDGVIVPSIPVLNHETRFTMSEAVFFLVKEDSTQYETVLDHLSSLVPYVEGIDDGPYSYDLPYMFDRAKSIRSPTGYVGLKNLSNTCYLNSLFTQLFMNVSFREFMLGATVADGGASQKLLHQTQILFSHMQNTLTRFVDPTGLAASIRTYDETNIDVNIQMDVDEFYNLLFDRWEGQILAPDAKKQFRSFYGGQLVQQVKSKECSHISERLEPFSAIQCDIKGKTCLQESLQAYVDGEVMEGDNKYKCSTCDRHVDAVKRACLKDIPDNLIFHLKRFDFNLRTLQRSKINDHFSFPDKIDMRPFKVEHLMDSSAESPEDVFELVGVLVHAGTAESGHYYSFIRERPSTSNKDNWVEFNDDTVTAWDPGYMEAACFGGLEARGPIENATMAYDKSYSAYMLFYQRSSVVAAQKQALEASQMTSPVHLPLPTTLSNHIATENESLMRKYCLNDPSHLAFVSRMLMNIKKINGGHCSSTHSLERKALWVTLNHLDQVVSRAKDIPDFAKFMGSIRDICRACGECSRDFLEWLCACPEALRHLLMRNPEAVVRSDIASSILAALVKVKSDATYAYGIGDEELDELPSDDDPRVIQRVVRGLDKLWDIFHTSCRAWPEYFGLLANIASLGDLEAALLLDSGYLRKTLDIVNADPLLNLTPNLQRMLNIVSKRVNTRPVSYEAVIGLLLTLLQTCDASEKPLVGAVSRLDMAANGQPIPFTSEEFIHLTQHWTRSSSHIFAEKLLQLHQNPLATKQILITLLKWPDEREDLDLHIYHTLIHNIRPAVSAMPCSPFLKAAVIYCEHSLSEQSLELILHIAKVARQIDNSEGRAYLYFFKEVMALPSTASDTQITTEQITEACLEAVGSWGPGLLCHYDSMVRKETEQYLIEIIFVPASEESTEDTQSQQKERLQDTDKGSSSYEAVQRLGIACLEYLYEVFVRPRQTVVRATLSSINVMIESATPYFDSEEADAASHKFFQLKNSVIPQLKKLMVEEADEEVSDWNVSEDEYGSSALEESTADLCGTLNDDMNDQL